MARTFLFATIGGALVVISWMAVRYLIGVARIRVLEQRAAREAEIRTSQVAEEQGGNTDNPIVIQTPSLVESKASSIVCPKCGGPVRVLEHQARTIRGKRFRVAIVECSLCGFERDVFFYISSAHNGGLDKT